MHIMNKAGACFVVKGSYFSEKYCNLRKLGVSMRKWGPKINDDNKTLMRSVKYE